MNGEWVDGDVTIDGGVVGDVGVAGGSGRGSAVPGFVDVQVNGFAGVSFSACDRRDYEIAAAAIARHGVTSFLPTIPSAQPERYPFALQAAAEVIAEPPPGARPLGVHLEGPFLSPRRPGAHDPSRLRAPTVDAAEQLCRTAPIAMMTLAPELPGSGPVIDHLRARGVVVAAGHTDADATSARWAFDRGVTMVTHLWNAQRPMLSREPGLVGTALVRPGVFVGLIADLAHVSAPTLAVSLEVAAERAVVVTDASPAAGLADGTHVVDGREVVVGDGAVRLPDGTLTGASVGLDDCFRNLLTVGRTIEQALHAVTVAPAGALGRRDVGRLVPGGRADVVVLHDDMTIGTVIVAGIAA